MHSSKQHVQLPDDVRIVLADGRKVLMDGRVVNEVEIPKAAAIFSQEVVSGRAASTTLKRIHRKLGDLPDTPQKMNAIAAVLSYTSIGLSDADIATALGASETQIAILKDSEPYKQLEGMFDRTVFEDAKRDARHVIAQASGQAARTMAAALSSDKEDIRVVAAREVMKTAGIDLSEEKTRSLSGLKIVITRKGERDEAINVSVE